MDTKVYSAIAIGGSAGSMEALISIFSALPKDFKLPIITVCHVHPRDEGGLVEVFSRHVDFRVREVEDKEKVCSGIIYFAPANYHLLLESERTFALSVDEKVNYSRPSIDVFFDSAAMALGDGLIGILLTGANNDGATGIKSIKKYGGLTIAQNPEEAVHPTMPQAAIATGSVDRILSIAEIIRFLKLL